MAVMPDFTTLYDYFRSYILKPMMTYSKKRPPKKVKNPANDSTFLVIATGSHTILST